MSEKTGNFTRMMTQDTQTVGHIVSFQKSLTSSHLVQALANTAQQPAPVANTSAAAEQSISTQAAAANVSETKK
jgi:hypothetical protein